MLKRRFHISLFCCLSLCACDEPIPDQPVKSTAQVEQEAEAIQKNAIKAQELEIYAFIEKHKYEMTATGTGLRYQIYQTSEGDSAKPGLVAHVNYELQLLDGTVCYSNKGQKARSFVIEHDYVESGLHEAISYMRVGEKARIVMPSPLAHGLLGDRDCIPPFSPIFFRS